MLQYELRWSTRDICPAHGGHQTLHKYKATQPSASQTTLHSAAGVTAPAAHCGGSTCRTPPGCPPRCPDCPAPPELWVAHRSCSCAPGGPRPTGGGRCRCCRSAGDQLQSVAELCTCREGRVHCSLSGSQVTHLQKAAAPAAPVGSRAVYLQARVGSRDHCLHCRSAGDQLRAEQQSCAPAGGGRCAAASLTAE